MRPALAIAALLAVAIGTPAEAAASDGARVYAERCAVCHGDDGRGDGPAAAALVPKPRNLRDAAYWKDRTPAAVVAVIHDGKPGTMMMGFRDVLSDAEIAAVADYVRRFAPTAAK